MNKLLLSAALVAGLGVVALGAQTANAATASSGTITITGQVVSSTCNVLVNGSASPSIALPVLDTNTLTAGTSGGWTAVNMVLNGCGAVAGYTKVLPHFSGANIDTANGYLKNTTSGGSNVEIALSTSQGTAGALTLASTSGNQGAGSMLLSAAGATFNYYAGYVATAAATAGGVNTSVQYDLNYQ